MSPTTARPRTATRLVALAKEMGNAAVVRAIEILGDAIVDIRGQAVADPRLVLEVAVVRIARRESRTRDESLLDRVERLEQKLAGGAPMSSAGPVAPVAPATAPSTASPPPARTAPQPGGPVLARRERAVKPAKTEPAPKDPAPSAPAAPTAVDAAPEPDTDASPPPTFALDDVIEAWPATLAILKAPLRAGIQDAQPIALENGIIVFGVPKVRYDAINERFRKEAAAIKDAFAQRLGAAPRFMLRPHDFGAPDAFRPGAVATGAGARGPAAQEPEPEPEPEDEDVDLTELDDAPDAPPQPDSVTRLVAGLGAEVIDERRRG